MEIEIERAIEREIQKDRERDRDIGTERQTGNSLCTPAAVGSIP